MSIFGERLRLLRKERAMTQSDLAELLNVSTSSIGMIEQGRRDPSIDLICNASKLFCVTTDYLIGASYLKDSHLTLEESELLIELDFLSDKSINSLEKFIKLLKIKEASKDTSGN